MTAVNFIQSNQLERIPGPMKALAVLIRDGIKDSEDWIYPPVGDNVFAGPIPKNFVKKFGHKSPSCISLHRIPSPEDMSTAPRSWIRVDVCSFGENYSIAEDVDLAVYALLKPLNGAVVKFDDDRQGIFIWSAIPSGSMTMRDPKLDWPYYLRPYRIRVGERNQLLDW